MVGMNRMVRRRSGVGAVLLIVRTLVARRGGRRSRQLALAAWVAAAIGLALVALVPAPAWALAVVGVLGLVALVSSCLAVLTGALAVAVIGIALSCASLLTTAAITRGFEVEIARVITGVNGHVLVTKYGLDFFEYERIAEDWLDDPRVRAASPFAFSMVAVVGDHLDQPAIVVGKGIDPGRARALRSMSNVLHGGDVAALRPADPGVLPGIAIGTRVARRLGVAPGDEVRVVVPPAIDGRSDWWRKPPRQARFELVDVVDSGVSDIDAQVVMMHLTAAQALFFGERRATGIEFELTDIGDTQAVAEEIRDQLGYPFRTTTWDKTNAPLFIGLRQIRVAVQLVIGLMMLVAASSLVAGLVLIVRRKRSLIAVLMSLGASRSMVFQVFEAVGLASGIVGAVIGVLVARYFTWAVAWYRYPLTADVYPIDHLPVAWAWSEVAFVSLAAIGLCAAASGPVAVFAAGLPVLRGLQR